MSGYSQYETIEIRPLTDEESVRLARYKLAVSDWTVCVDTVTKTAYEVNRKTGEQRPYDYDQAVREAFG